jgi:hypothetical protein
VKKFVPLVDIPYIRYESRLFSKVRYNYLEVSPERLLFIGSPYSKNIVFLGILLTDIRRKYKNLPERAYRNPNSKFANSYIFASNNPVFHYKGKEVKFSDCESIELFVEKVNYYLENIRTEMEIDNL